MNVGAEGMLGGLAAALFAIGPLILIAVVAVSVLGSLRRIAGALERIELRLSELVDREPDGDG